MDNKQSLRLNLLEKEQIETLASDILQKMKQGMTVQEATGVSDETLEEIYSLACGFYDQGRYKESISLFHFLAGASPTTYKYVLGLASSYHQVEAYEDATFGFYIAFNLEPDNPIPAYYATDCLLKQNLFEEAEEFVQMTILTCDDRPEYQNLQERCELIKKTLEDKK